MPICTPYNTNTQDQLKARITADIATPKQQLYKLPLTGDFQPNRMRQVFLNSFADLNFYQLKGIMIPSQSTDLSNSATLNGTFSTLATDQLAYITISIYDRVKNNYAVSNLPLALLVKGLSFKKPFPLFNCNPDMNKSFITINGAIPSAPGAIFQLLINFIYI